MSDFSYTKVDPKRLSAAAGSIDNGLNILDKVFRAVDDALTTTLKPTWHGPASEQFFNQYALDAQTFSSHTKALRSINTQLLEASGIYEKADNSAGELVRNLKTE